jgi:class 3 adenylate cyclase
VVVRDSTEFTDFYRDRVLAKLYRAYASETMAIMNSNPKCVEINITGNYIYGIYDTPFNDDVDEVFSTAAKISTLIDILNYQFKSNNLKELTAGIGISYGQALLIRASHKGNEVIWMGDVIREASMLASYGNKEATDRETMVSEVIYYNLNEKNKSVLSFNSARNCYQGNVVNSFMKNWFKQNCP